MQSVSMFFGSQLGALQEPSEVEPVSLSDEIVAASQERQDPAVEDLGDLLRRIIHSNSGAYPRLSSPAPLKHSADWTAYKVAAEVAMKYGNYCEAETAWLRALAMAEKFESNDPRVAYTLENMANFYFTDGQLEKAEDFYKRAIAVIEQVYGENHVKVALCLNDLAGLYYTRSRFAEAEPLTVRVLKIYNKVFGSNHADVGMAANNLAMLYHAQGKLELAEMMYARALPIRKQALGHNHPQYRTLVENYANLCLSIGSMSKAEQLRAEYEGWQMFECRIPLQAA